MKKKDDLLINSLYKKLKTFNKDGWKIKNKTSKEKVCSWKSMPANNTCDIEKDKGCKIIKPDIFGTETIYLLEK